MKFYSPRQGDRCGAVTNLKGEDCPKRKLLIEVVGEGGIGQYDRTAASLGAQDLGFGQETL